MEIKERFGINEDDLQVVDNQTNVKIKFTRYGFETTIVEINVPYGEALTQEQNDELLTIGIIISGVSNDFTLEQQKGDISIEFIKGENDSYIDFPNFENGKIIFREYELVNNQLVQNNPENSEN